MVEIQNTITNDVLPFLTSSTVIRSLFALLAGAIIGLDRAIKRRGAGIKTHALVCVGAALVMMTSEYMNETLLTDSDLSRMGAQVISGVGFLGVGTIMITEKNRVKGLTTAAGLWTCACVGLAIGIGFFEGATVVLLLVIISLRLFGNIDHWLATHSKYYNLYIEFETDKSIGIFIKEMSTDDIQVSIGDITKSRFKGEGTSAVISIVTKKRSQGAAMIEKIRKLEYVKHLEIL